MIKVNDVSIRFAKTCVVLEVAPGGDSLNDDNPDALVRSLAFGPAHQGLCSCRPGGQPGLFEYGEDSPGAVEHYPPRVGAR